LAERKRQTRDLADAALRIARQARTGRRAILPYSASIA
jgi:hypothetical protein